ncbi:NUDIX domain-containing protein [Schlesneria paludicola]|uniref:NUDIX domain-containing protein n=1 Tax=Schlesneria paludicola TaxID=360056 RepID=UPI00029AB1A5|nr:NUDIX domain-containing protein [Schlesneria paludicola]
MGPVHTHFGVYAVVIQEFQVLTVRKARGPYTGLLDLPGGAPNPGETRDEALIRELREEAGGVPIQFGPWNRFDILVDRDSVGRPIEFRHSGEWRSVILTEIQFGRPALEDVVELEWIELSTWERRDDLSAALRAVLIELPDHRPGVPSIEDA